MTKKQIKDNLDFINKVTKQERLICQQEEEQEKKECRIFFALLKGFVDVYEKAKPNLQHHINVIDELRPKAHENAHSRILAKLLQYKNPENYEYEILENLIKYIVDKKGVHSFENIRFKTPTITHEKERIDLRIIEQGNYAIIVENKINEAGDMAKQLYRYIEKTRSNGFKDEQIYVIYLSTDKKPDEQTWGDEEEKFRERYVYLSFKDDILRWLNSISFLNEGGLQYKYLSSALEQYIDHLEGMFNIRKINQEMNNKLQEFIIEELELIGTPQENFYKLEAKQEEIRKLNVQIDLLKKKIEEEVHLEECRKWKTSLEEDFAEYEKIDSENEVGICITVDRTKIRVVLSFSGFDPYCQVDMDLPNSKDRILPKEVVKKIEHLLTCKHDKEGMKKSQIWEFLPKYEYGEAYKLLQKVVPVLTEKK